MRFQLFSLSVCSVLQLYSSLHLSLPIFHEYITPLVPLSASDGAPCWIKSDWCVWLLIDLMVRGIFPTYGRADSYCDRFDWGWEEQEMSIATHQPIGHHTAGQQHGSLAHRKLFCQMWSLCLWTLADRPPYLDGCQSCTVNDIWCQIYN